ncbi:MAG: hypothetical protein CBC42_05550 [Betaproteobacteria bacterium TMED82]|nr:MAG: hypothetical protein CBC42_05550 [Betaproteobacteria bacterium TMED82]
MGVAGMQQACDKARELLKILEMEFIALKEQKLDEFEELQLKKEPILLLLSSLDVPKADPSDSEDAWAPLREIVSQCKEAHRKNEILINRKLDSIRLALNTMTGNSQGSHEMYDKLGKISQRRSRKKFLEA